MIDTFVFDASVIGKCLRCGTWFNRTSLSPQGQGPKSKHCFGCKQVEQDRHGHRFRTVVRILSCPLCGLKFSRKETARTKNPFCSPRCLHLATYQNAPAERERECLDCGKSFVAARTGSAYPRRCFSCRVARSTEMRRRANTSDRNDKRVRRIAYRLQRIDRLEVFRRDGWNCMICGDRIDPTLRNPDPLSASVDHVIPLSKGGTHSWANVQTAHLSCNMSKGNKSGAASGRSTTDAARASSASR